MLIDEGDILTNLPSSEEAFYSGIEEAGITIKEAMTFEGASKMTSMGAVSVSACLFGHNYHHLHKPTQDDGPHDLANGEFWKRHRNMDNVLASTFMFLPDHMRLPNGLRDMNIVFFHMNVHTSAMCVFSLFLRFTR